MTNKSENINTSTSSISEDQNSTAQTKRINFTSTEISPIQTNELTQKEILQIIKEKSQIEGKIEGFKSLHR